MLRAKEAERVQTRAQLAHRGSVWQTGQVPALLIGSPPPRSCTLPLLCICPFSLAEQA